MKTIKRKISVYEVNFYRNGWNYRTLTDVPFKSLKAIKRTAEVLNEKIEIHKTGTITI